MSFEERINTLFSVLNCSNAEIARLSDIDSSVVSRFRTGARIPRKNSSQFEKLCGGIALYSDTKGMADKVTENCGLPGNDSLKAEIENYLLPDKGEAKVNSVNLSFAGKLNSLMQLTGTANIRLARALNIDSSLVSRFRNGYRTPLKDTKLINELCEYLYKKVISSNSTAKLAELLNVPVTKIEREKEAFIGYLMGWITDDANAYTVNIIDSLLEKLSAYKKNDEKPYPIAGIISEARRSTTGDYTGTEGFIQAVMRLLCSVAGSGNDCMLKLYANFKPKMPDDTDFNRKLATVCDAVMSVGCQFTYINDTQMSLEDMTENIKLWLPYYIKGAVASYCYNSPGSNRISNLLFLSPQTAALSGSFVAGTENTGIYRYYTNAENVLYYDSQFNSLLQTAKPFVQVYNDRNSDKYYFRLGDMADKEGGMHKMLTSLSVATMPKRLLAKILARSGILGSKVNKILYLHDIRVRQFQKELARGGVTEYLALPDDEALFSGKERINMAELCIDLPIPYTGEEYSEHIAAIYQLLTENENYNIISMREKAYPNIQLLYKANAGAVIIRNEEPTAAFWLEYPVVSGAVKTYIEAAVRAHSITADKKIPAANGALLSKLKKYID